MENKVQYDYKNPKGESWLSSKKVTGANGEFTVWEGSSKELGYKFSLRKVKTPYGDKLKLTAFGKLSSAPQAKKEEIAPSDDEDFEF